MTKIHLLHGHLPWRYLLGFLVLLVLISRVLTPPPEPLERRACGLEITLFILALVFGSIRYLLYKIFRF